MLRRGLKVVVRVQQNQVMSATELDQQCVDASDLDSAAATGISDLGGFHVVLAVRYQESQGRKPLYKLISRPGSGETLKKLLKYQTGREYLIGAKERVAQRRHLGRALHCIAAKRERPHARVDEETHRLRERSAL
jgi:hypothetical protein